uniref:FAM86 N-terminal domain-containing protein n=1 Tax=Clastoptera arizonana TaxID=38151 RepID=A0A1B6DGU6_9HEMI
MTSSLPFQLIRKQFLSTSDIKTIDWTDVLNQVENNHDPCKEQDHLLKLTVLHSALQKYPIKLSYVQFFLKSLIQQLEDRGVEVSAKVYTTYCGLLEYSNKEVEEFHYRHFMIDEYIVTIKESSKIISHGTTGLCCWQGAIALAEWCLLNKDLVKGKHILELGAGVGLTGIAVTKSCIPASYTFSDYHTAVLQVLEENVEINSGSKKEGGYFIGNTPIEVIKLNWEEIGETYTNFLHQPNLILAADVIYDDTLFLPLILTLKYFLLSACEVQAVIACTVRDPNTIQRFINQLDENGFSFSEFPVLKPKVFVYSTNTPIKIFIIKQKK